MTVAWRDRFFTFWAAQAVSLIGSNLAQFAITWWLAKSTDSATVLSTAVLVATLPGVVLGPLVGVLVDHWNRRIVILMADGIAALAAAVLVLLFWTGAVWIWHIYLITLVRALAGTFHFTAVQSSTSLMVPPEHLARIAGLNQAIQGINMVVAPPLGALLLELLSLQWIKAIDVVTALIAMVLVFLIAIPQPQASALLAGYSSILGDLRAGFLYIWSWPALFALLLMSALLNFLVNPGFALPPVLVTRHFHGSAMHLASLNTTLGLGFILGGVLLSMWGGFKRQMYTGLSGLVGMSAGTLFLGLAPPDAYWLSIVGIGIFGIANPIANGPFMAIMQSVVAQEMQGRFLTVSLSLAQCMTPVGLVVAGPLADALGIQIWFLVSTIGILAMSAVIFCTPKLMHVEDGRPEGPITGRK